MLQRKTKLVNNYFLMFPTPLPANTHTPTLTHTHPHIHTHTSKPGKEKRMDEWMGS